MVSHRRTALKEAGQHTPMLKRAVEILDLSLGTDPQALRIRFWVALVLVWAFLGVLLALSLSIWSGSDVTWLGKVVAAIVILGVGTIFSLAAWFLLYPRLR